jgi:hypothetical protein
MRRLVLGVVLGLTLLASNLFAFVGTVPDVQAARPTFTCYYYYNDGPNVVGPFFDYELTRKEARQLEIDMEVNGIWIVECTRDPR